MAELKTDYKDDVLDASVNEKRLFNIVSKDGTVLFENVSLQDITVYTQNGDTFGAGDVNKQNQKINECFQSVSDGKNLVASAITDKRVPTDATATFAQMAANILKIVLGSGNALSEHVLFGKTFTNDDGVEYAGTMQNQGAVTGYVDGTTGNYTIPKGFHNGNGFVTTDNLRQSVITAMKNTNQGLTEESSWVDICNVLTKLFPKTFNVLSFLGVSSISKSGQNGTWTSAEFDITTFKTMTVSASWSDGTGGKWYPAWSGNNPVPTAYLCTTSGNISLLRNGSVDISSYTGKAYISIYTSTGNISDSVTGSSWGVSSSVTISKLILQA